MNEKSRCNFVDPNLTQTTQTTQTRGQADEPALSASPTRVASYPITSPDNAQIQSQPQASARRRQNRATTQPNPEPVYDDSVFNTHNDARRAQSEPQKGVLRRMTTGLFTPERKVGKAPSFLASFKAAILSSWM